MMTSEIPPHDDARPPQTCAIIGAGPAGLIAAEHLAAAGLRVTVYERMPSVGRKFLMAGRGGLNLTHSEAFDRFIERYGDARGMLEAALRAFPPEALRSWSEGLGVETFIGSSGRVFPRSFKASPLLRAWLQRLGREGVTIALRHSWRGWDAQGMLRFDTPGGEIGVKADATLLALGGGSWPRLGSDGSWVDILRAEGMTVSPLTPSNVGFDVAWSDHFRDRHEGAPLKRIALRVADRSVRGEAVITRQGLEGGAVYAISPVLRTMIAETGSAAMTVDLRPDLTAEALAERIGRVRKGQSLASVLRKAAGLDPAAAGLLREAHRDLTARDPAALAQAIKECPLVLSGMRPLDRAISSAGGIALTELDARFMLRKRPGVFAAGEMLDWEAPTGGYLLQACFATGRAAAQGVIETLTERI